MSGHGPLAPEAGGPTSRGPGERGPGGRVAGTSWAHPGLLTASVLAVLTLLRLAFIAGEDLDLSPDEAHYWEWSRRLDLSYYSKGPLVAYLIAGLTSLLGTSAFSIRVGAVALSVVGAWALYRLGRQAFGEPGPGALAVVGLQLTPLFWAGSLLMTIDPPFLVAWTVALGLGRRALRIGGLGCWAALGAVVGLGLLAKYTMLFVVPGLALYAVSAPEARRGLRGWGPATGTAAALAVFSPVLLWNMRTGWVSFHHVASQGRGTGGLTLRHLAEFLGSQAGLLTPLCAGVLAWGLWVGIREGLARGREPYRFLAAVTVPILVVYGALSLQGKVQANWAAAAYPPLALLTAGLLIERRRALDGPRRRSQTRWLVAAGLMAAVASLAGHVTPQLGVPPRLDPATRLRGWAELGHAVGTAVAAMPDPGRTFLLSDRYQVTSELAFYVPGRPPAYNLNLGRRLNQYDFWAGPESRVGWDAVYVEEGVRPLDPRVTAAFQRVEGPVRVDIRRAGRVVRTFVVYAGHGFLGVADSTDPVRF